MFHSIRALTSAQIIDFGTAVCFKIVQIIRRKSEGNANGKLHKQMKTFLEIFVEILESEILVNGLKQGWAFKFHLFKFFCE